MSHPFLTVSFYRKLKSIFRFQSTWIPAEKAYRKISETLVLSKTHMILSKITGKMGCLYFILIAAPIMHKGNRKLAIVLWCPGSHMLWLCSNNWKCECRTFISNKWETDMTSQSHVTSVTTASLKQVNKENIEGIFYPPASQQVLCIHPWSFTQ